MNRLPGYMALVAIAGLRVCSGAPAGEQTTHGEKLQIVLMLGQSEMVGRGDVASFGYMLQKPLVPPREATLSAHKAMAHQPNGAYLYWQAMNSYGGPEAKKLELKSLIKERADFKAAFKQQVVAELEKSNGVFRGKTYGKRRGAYRGFWLFNLCDTECETVGLTPKIRAILEAPDNAFNVAAAYDQLISDGAARYQRQLELNERYLKGTTTADFAAYSQSVKDYEATMATKDMTLKDKRLALAGLAGEHLHLPAAERTYITALGTVAGMPQGDAGSVASGKLTIGFGASERSIGLEYAAGLALEQEVAAPILIAKCAWDDRRSIADFWRNPLKEGAEPPGEPVAEPGWAWTRTEAHVKSILADPGTYHPDYDPKVGFEVAGVIWFQGSREPNNPEYAAQLASLLSDIRETVKMPDLPIVCATVGRMYFKGESDDHPVNQALRTVAAMPSFAGTVDVMDSYRWRSAEVAVLQAMIRKRRFTPDAAMQERLRAAREGAFNLLAGHEAGVRLAKLMKMEN
jgi:hypothetical protein